MNQDDEENDDDSFLASFVPDSQEGDNDAEDDFLSVKRSNHELDIELPVSESENTNVSKKPKKPVTKASVVKKILKKKILPNKKIVFNDDGEVRALLYFLRIEFFFDNSEAFRGSSDNHRNHS